MHLMLEMIEVKGGTICATCETVMVNVDLILRRSCEYSEFTHEKLIKLYNASEKLRATTKIGQPIGLIKKESL